MRENVERRTDQFSVLQMLKEMTTMHVITILIMEDIDSMHFILIKSYF